MFRVQEIIITTKEKREFSVILEERLPDVNICRLKTLSRGVPVPEKNFNTYFRGDGIEWEMGMTRDQTAKGAFKFLIQGFTQQLKNYDPDDLIVEINNPCNTELLTKEEQETVLSSNVTVKVNGQ